MAIRQRPALVSLTLALALIGAGSARSGDLGILRFFQRKHPPTCKDMDAERLAEEIDWLEALIETYGTIVPKHPDVWGEARLTKHRHEIEQQMSTELNQFRETVNASIRRSDQSYFGAALSISAALSEGAQPASTSEMNALLSVVNDPETSIDRNEAGTLPAPTITTSSGERPEKIEGISLEPTVYLQQKFRYLQLLNELRRINEGDDTSDAPGYSLNLVRIPVSVLPGRMTQRDFGAEITFTATSHLTPELLPQTFRSLVINDIVDILALPGQKVLDHPDIICDLKEMVDRRRCAQEKRLFANGVHTNSDNDNPGVLDEEDQRLLERMEKYGVTEFAGALVAGRSTQPLGPFPPAHMIDVFGPGEVFAPIVLDGTSAFGDHPVHRNYPHLPDIESYLNAELNAAYEFLSHPDAAILWAKYCTPQLVSAVRQRRRYVSNKQYKMITGLALFKGQERPAIFELRDDFFDDVVRMFPRAAYSTTASLAWAIIVDSALLNARLAEDMQKVAVEKDRPEVGAIPGWPDFYLPQPSLEARTAFNEYVAARWPVKVFALDPVLDEQNVIDAYSARREMQLAAAVALASGEISANAAFQFVRRLEEDIETISLNRKVIGFAHGHNTFGWRFYPRVQTPPTVNNAVAFLQTVVGTSYDKPALEPGMRELTAVVLMPSFVPQLEFGSRANWFKLDNPKEKELTLHDAMKISRSWQSVRSAAPALCNAECYRGEDLMWLGKTVEQLERRLPLQSMLVSVPHENTLGGFEMFNSGITDLAPALRGWYGAPGITLGGSEIACKCCDPSAKPCPSVEGIPFAGIANYGTPQCAGTCLGTTLFLVGKHFSVHDTKVIAGGRCVPFELVSREIMRITVPPTVMRIKDDCGRCVVDVHVSTPYGVSNHLLVRGLPGSSDKSCCPEPGAPCPPRAPSVPCPGAEKLPCPGHDREELPPTPQPASFRNHGMIRAIFAEGPATLRRLPCVADEASRRRGIQPAHR